jgi:TRAP transporter TAXI family solute receptor
MRQTGEEPMSDIAARLLAAAALACFVATPVSAQTYGFATMQPGTLNHTTASAVAKVVKEKAGLNMLVQPTAGDTVIIPMVNRGEVDIGIANTPELHNAWDGQGPGGKAADIRILATAHPLRSAYWVRKDTPMRKVSDLKGKKVAMGFSAMRALDPIARAILATGGLTERDVVPVLVPNVIRGADDFVSGAADMFFFAFGAPKVREVDATVGGIRVLEIDDSRMPEARRIMPWGYLTDAAPGPIFIGVEKPMKVYTFDNVLFTSAKASEDFVYKVLKALDENNAELVSVQPVLREFSAAAGYKKYGIPYHPGALKYFREKNLQPRDIQ